MSGVALAAELKISVRTLYRDIAALQAQGARIDGEPGVGYVLRPGFMLPPLMFSQDELEALVLGSLWVSERADAALKAAAQNAIAKIAAVLPPDLRHAVDASALLIGPVASIAAGDERSILGGWLAAPAPAPPLRVNAATVALNRTIVPSHVRFVGTMHSRVSVQIPSPLTRSPFVPSSDIAWGSRQGSGVP